MEKRMARFDFDKWQNSASYLKRFPYFCMKNMKNRRQKKKEIKEIGEKEEEGISFT
jgi:hypothetical protein